MPLSHIGLTVSHLPTSCSFYLAALAPLGYRYIGQSGNQIGFGIDDAEFFISQEAGSIKSSSAHIAFLAPSRNVVDNFFIAALKAGGRIHGEPTERDPTTGYYSAAVLDFDDNSIEVMHRVGKAPNAHHSDHGQEADRVLSWQKDVAASTVSRTSRSTRASPRVVVTNITKPTIMVSDQTNQAKAGSDMNSKTFIGTLLGAAAGAAVAYAMTKGDEGSNKSLENITYQAVEAARSQLAPSATGTQTSHPQTTFSSTSQRGLAITDYPRSQASIASHDARSAQPSSWHNQTNQLTIAAPLTPLAQASTLIDTFVPPYTPSLERIVREASANGEHDRIARIVHQLCHDYAYAVHQPHARNGGLIGLAAASIALGSEEVAKYLKEIVPPVLACFSDQDARVRYYACESMYNIAKVAKGEILLFFNDVFDALCKLAADAELSVKNGAELLDRLVKDIVSESAATYVSVLHSPERISDKDSAKASVDSTSVEVPTAFSLARFIPLLQERIFVLSPFTRTFLVSWVTLLDTIPDLELVYYLPAFLGGLFKFLSDPNRDVHVATQGALERFLTEVKKIAKIKRGIEESRRSHSEGKPKASSSSDSGSVHTEHSAMNEKSDIADGESGTALGSHDSHGDGDWVPGQDVQVDHPKILEILVTFLDSPSEEETKTALRWIDNFFEVCPEDILAFVPSLLSKVLPAMASEVDAVRQTASRLNTSLMDFIVSLPDESSSDDGLQPAHSKVTIQALRGADEKGRRLSTPTLRTPQPSEFDSDSKGDVESSIPTPPTEAATTSTKPTVQLDYAAAVGALTLHFLNEHEATRVASLAWLIMLHRRAPGKVLATNDGTFPALLKTLSDPAEAVVTRDLQLLSQISKNSDDSYFNLFMTNLLQLFCTDRRLLETRCNLIIRQLCVSLSAERIYRTLADCLEKDEDLEFASIMVQNLNNNLITAPELADLRKRLRNLETRDGQTFFVALFRSWCHNAVATFSLCLLAQAYEQAYNLLQIFAELEMTVNMLIQIDKLVQLLESPVFTYLRLQLLEPEKYPHLYKCLYGLLMLLPQSSAFAALKNRLNSVSAIGYLHIAPRAYVSSSSSLSHVRQQSTEIKFGSTPPTPTAAFDRPNRLKAREEGVIRWVELLDKFKAVQERARRASRSQTHVDDGTPAVPAGGAADGGKEKLLLPSDGPKQGSRPLSAGSAAAQRLPPPSGPMHKPKSSLGNLGRFTSGVGGRKGKK
ncbi:MAG: hypothetical protein Q9172_000085 [Xanthocarpia lactea]